jgi:hypothetical protein
MADRNTLVAVVRQELAQARGSARAVLAAAESARAEAQRRKRLVRDAYSTCLAQLAAARDAARQDILRRYGVESAALGSSVESLATLCAAGGAGAPWEAWAPLEPDRTSRSGLLRIGTIAYGQSAVPALLPLLDGAHLSFTGDQMTADDVITGLLLRALGSTRPGDLRLSVYDPEHLGGTLAAFAPLSNARLLSLVSPGGLGAHLDELVEHICRVRETVLAGEYTSLAQLVAASTGPRAEPWRVLVVLTDAAGAAELTSAQRAQLDRIVRMGVACGVHLLVRGLELAPHRTVRRVTVAPGKATCDSTGDLTVDLDEPPAAEQITEFCRSAIQRLRAGRGPARLGDLEPEKLWIESSAPGLVAPIGDGPDGQLVMVSLGDEPPHALIGGPAGSGKTNLIHAWLGSLAARYGPAELACYLLDFKGESFTRFAPVPDEPSWLPQAHLAGVNVGADREFGLATLRHLSEQLRFRTQVGRRYATDRLAELRVEDPGGHWPRIVAVIDEFQMLLAGRDAIADEAMELLEDLARRGGPQGIHLVLAAQEVSGIEALREQPGLVEQFTLRIALPEARRILADDNLAAALIPRFHAVVNTASGVVGANQIVRLPDAGDREGWRALQRKLWDARPDDAIPPRHFDGDAVPRLPDAYRPAGRVPDATPGAGSSPGAVLGQRIDVAAWPVRLRLGRMPGRNLAVLGTRSAEACDVLASAALSLAAQGPARFSVACMDPDARSAAALLVAELPRADWYGPGDVLDLFDVVNPDGVPHYVLGYAFDAAPPACRARLRTLLTSGPEHRVHVLGWWRSVDGLRDDLGGAGARTDAIGAWVALDVDGPDLGPLSPQPGGPVWQPRARRALFFDRSVHRIPEVIIPYEVNSDHT